MKKLNKIRTRKGAASFYIVAFSTLILVVMAISFAMVIISEISRTSNDDLSQSAYDSAMAGVEDAKVAYANYRRCVELGFSATQPTGNGNTPTCGEIMWWMEKEHANCYMTGHILGRLNKNEDDEVKLGGQIVSRGSKETTTNQAYTCVKINADLYDYRATLSDERKVQTFRLASGTGLTNDVSRVRISWYSVRSDIPTKYSNFSYNKVVFPELAANTIAIPPTIEVKILQTAVNWRMSDFDIVENGNTDRATLYFVPTSSSSSATTTKPENYIGIYNGSINLVSSSQVAKTNDHFVRNVPFLTYCDPRTTNEFYCTAEIELPGVIGGQRSNETFMMSVTLPYQQPNTDFSVELICDSGSSCGSVYPAGDGRSDSVARITNSQISIDSTGRANDLYRRVEVRMETGDMNYGAPYPHYALQILGNEGTEKDMKVSSEHNFYF